MDLLINSITGQLEMLTQFDVTRKRAVNGDRYISVSVIKTKKNSHSYPLILNENIFIYDNEKYVIKKHKEDITGDTVKVSCTAIHKMFDDLINYRIYETTSGTKTLNQLISFSLAGSGYTYSVITDGLPTSVLVENFGDENSLALLKDILNKFGAEFDINGTHITIKAKIGSVTNSQLRYKFNISNPSKEIDTDNLATYIRGYGKMNEDGTYAAEVEYTSTLAQIYGIRHAPPVRDERFTNNESLMEECIRQLNDSIDMSLTLTYVQLKKMGINSINIGDYVWCIIDPFDILVRIRVLEKEDYSNSNKSPVFTLGSITKKASDILAEFNTTKKTVDKLTQPGGIKYSFLDDTVKRATEALQSAQTELEFTNGIIAREKENENKLVVFNSAGLGISTDGGETFRTAVTSDGIVADVITVGTLKGITIDGVEIYGSRFISENNDNHYTRIEDSRIETKGTYERIWRGQSEMNTCKVIIDNGQIRARNDDHDWSLYFNDYGISTFSAGDGDGEQVASGIIEFHSSEYSPTNGKTGLTFYSLAGRIALETDNSRIYLNTGGSNVYVADMQDNFFPISAASFNQSSSEKLKRDIKDLQDNALEVIESLKIREYKRLTNGKVTPLDKWQAGLILEETPFFLTDGVGVDIYSLLAYALKGIQDLHVLVKDSG